MNIYSRLERDSLEPYFDYVYGEDKKRISLEMEWDGTQGHVECGIPFGMDRHDNLDTMRHADSQNTITVFNNKVRYEQWKEYNDGST